MAVSLAAILLNVHDSRCQEASRGAAAVFPPPPPATAPSPGELPARTLHLLPTLPLGELNFIDIAQRRWLKPKITKSCSALGNISVPAGTIVKLKVSWEASGDLSRLRCLKPNDVQILDLNGTRTTDKSLTEVERLTGLYCLSLRDTDITDDAISHLLPLKHLKALVLTRTDTTARCYKQLAKLTELEEFSDHSNNLTADGFSDLAALKNLRAIELQSTKVNDACMAVLGKLANLNDVRLDKTSITDAGMKQLGSLANMRLLSLDYCPLTNKSVPVLCSFKRLKSLTISHTKIDSRGAGEITKAHPGMVMKWGERQSDLERDLAPALLKFTTPKSKDDDSD